MEYENLVGLFPVLSARLVSNRALRTENRLTGESGVAAALCHRSPKGRLAKRLVWGVAKRLCGVMGLA